jgi:hypothetical protein
MDISEDRIKGFLIGVMTDGFNRSVGALEEAGAIDASEMRTQYKGIGSKYYDVVTKELEYTAEFAAKEFAKFIEESKVENK